MKILKTIFTAIMHVIPLIGLITGKRLLPKKEMDNLRELRELFLEIINTSKKEAEELEKDEPTI